MIVDRQRTIFIMLSQTNDHINITTNTTINNEGDHYRNNRMIAAPFRAISIINISALLISEILRYSNYQK